MSGQGNSPRLWLACGLVALAMAAFILSCRLTALAPGTPSGGNSVVARLLGGSGALLGERFYEEADRYFHSGVGHHRDVVERKDWFFRIGGLMRPQEHVHLAGYKVADILPWLNLATRVNPGNVEPYLVAAFWLGQLGEYEEAHAVLAQARRNIPFSHEVALDSGRLFLHQGNDDAAYRCFKACIAFAGRKGPDDEDALRNLKAARLYTARIEERRRAAAAETGGLPNPPPGGDPGSD